jgi:hypothetical protein
MTDPAGYEVIYLITMSSQDGQFQTNEKRETTNFLGMQGSFPHESAC